MAIRLGKATEEIPSRNSWRIGRSKFSAILSQIRRGDRVGKWNPIISTEQDEDTKLKELNGAYSFFLLKRKEDPRIVVKRRDRGNVWVKYLSE